LEKIVDMIDSGEHFLSDNNYSLQTKKEIVFNEMIEVTPIEVWEEIRLKWKENIENFVNHLDKFNLPYEVKYHWDGFSYNYTNSLNYDSVEVEYDESYGDNRGDELDADVGPIDNLYAKIRSLYDWNTFIDTDELFARCRCITKNAIQRVNEDIVTVHFPLVIHSRERAQIKMNHITERFLAQHVFDPEQLEMDRLLVEPEDNKRFPFDVKSMTHRQIIDKYRNLKYNYGESE